MKTIITFLLFSVCCFGQHHFTIKNNTIFWEKVIPADSLEHYDLKNNLKLSFTNSTAGLLKNGRCTCKKSFFQFKNAFTADFRIQKEGDETKIYFYNFVFSNKEEKNVYNVNPQPTFTHLEEISMKRNSNSFIDSKINHQSLVCLDDYLQKLITQ